MRLEDIFQSQQDLDDTMQHILDEELRLYMAGKMADETQDEASQLTEEEWTRLKAVAERYRAMEAYPIGTGAFTARQQARLNHWDLFIDKVSLDMEVNEDRVITYLDERGTRHL